MQAPRPIVMKQKVGVAIQEADFNVTLARRSTKRNNGWSVDNTHNLNYSQPDFQVPTSRRTNAAQPPHILFHRISVLPDYLLLTEWTLQISRQTQNRINHIHGTCCMVCSYSERGGSSRKVGVMVKCYQCVELTMTSLLVNYKVKCRPG